MAVAIGTGTPTASATPATGTSLTTGNLTITGSNLVILVSLAFNTASATPTSITVSWSLGSGTVALVSSVNANNSYELIYAIPAPTAGTGTVSASWTNSAPAQLSATYFIGAHQTTPCPTGDAVTNTTQNQPVTVTPLNLTANDASYGGAGSNAFNPTGVTPTQTYLSSSTAINMQAGYATGTTGVTFTYDALACGQSMVAARIVEAAAGSASISPSVSPSLSASPSPTPSASISKSPSASASASVSPSPAVISIIERTVFTYVD